MDPWTLTLVVSQSVTAVALVLTVRAVRQMVGVMRLGQPASRTDKPLARTVTMLKESLLHTRMLQWHWIGALPLRSRKGPSGLRAEAPVMQKRPKPFGSSEVIEVRTAE